MSTSVQVVDNFLPQHLADYLENMLLGGQFPWYYTRDITHGNLADIEVKNPAFTHNMYREGIEQTVFNTPALNLPFLGVLKMPPSMISRAIALLQTPQVGIERALHNNIHIDSPNPHTVLLYYVCDSDGDTFLFSTDKDDTTITKQVSPKKNRVLIFDGGIYHASGKPKSSHRCVINFNLTPSN